MRIPVLPLRSWVEFVGSNLVSRSESVAWSPTLFFARYGTLYGEAIGVNDDMTRWQVDGSEESSNTNNER
jgi:hypothetical protein